MSSVTIDAQGKATIAWSDTLNGTARAKGATVTLPAALAIPNSSLIWSEVQYTYKPVIGYVVTGTLTLKDQIYMRPRLSDYGGAHHELSRLIAQAIGSAVVDLIFSIAKRDVTFFSGTVAISRL